MSNLLDLIEKTAADGDIGFKDRVMNAYKGVMENPDGKVKGLQELAKSNPNAAKGAKGLLAALGVGGAAVAGRKALAKPSMMDQAAKAVRKNPRFALGAAAAGLGGIALAKNASEQDETLEFAKLAAQEMAEDCMAKLAFAEQLYNEATYVDQVHVKQASEVDEIDSDGSALESFLQELDNEGYFDEEE